MNDDQLKKVMARIGGDQFGDHVERIFKATGIHQAVKAIERITGKDCGCAKRKEKLNELGQRLGIGVPNPPDP
jgi:hypothetical protein